MKIYRVHMTGDFDQSDSRCIWFRRKADFPKYKEALMEQCADAESRVPPSLETFEVPTKKNALIGFLNVWCNR